MNSKKRGRQIYSHRQTCLTFLRDRWSSTEHDVKTPLLVSGGACDGSGGLGCIFLSKIKTQPNELSIRKEHWLPTPGGVTCIANAATYGNENEIDVLVIGTETGNVCVVHADKFNGKFKEQETKVFQLESDPRVACSTTAISTARHGNNAVVVTDSGGVYMLTELQQVQQHQSGQSSPKVTKFNVRENSGLNDVAHLQETDCFVTAGASPVAQLKVWDPRVSADGNAIVATFKDENSNVAYTSVASHPQDKHLVMTGTNDGNVCIWDIRSERVRNRLKKHTGSVTSVAFSIPDSQHVYTCCTNGIALHWDFKAHAIHNDNISSYYDHAASQNKLKVDPLWEKPLGAAACANKIAVPIDGIGGYVCVAYDEGSLFVSEV